MQKISIFLFLVTLHFFLYGQNNESNTFKNSFSIENINLNTDRDVYLSGETIWFTAGINFDNDVKGVSQILYIELFNEGQKSIVRKKYRINQGHADGALDIPSEFLSGVYFLRAYTHFNKNFAPEYFYYSAVQIINPHTNLPENVNLKKEPTLVQWNNLIKEYQPKPEYFTIESESSENGQKIISVSKPLNNQFPGRTVFSLELLDRKQKNLYKTDFVIENSAQIALPIGLINKPGLYYLVLRDNKRQIVKIHALIEQDVDNVPLVIKQNKSSFKKREEVKLDLITFEQSKISSLGIKVAQTGSILSAIDKIAIYLNEPLLLNSFLKYHFNVNDLSNDEADTFIHIYNQKLNLEAYKKVFIPPSLDEIKWVPEIRDIGLSGYVVDNKTQKPLEKIPVYLSVFKEFPQIHIYESRADGSFLFSINNFVNEKEVFLCPLFEELDEIELKINRDFSIIFPELKPIPLTIDSSDVDLIEQMWISSQTADAFKITAKDLEIKVGHLPYSFENPQISVVLDNYIETPTMEMVFKELVPSVRVRSKKDIYSLSVFDSDRELYYNDPLILVDNIPIFNVNELMKIEPENVEKIEVHKSPFILGDFTINGLIVIKTSTDNFGGMLMPKSSTFLDYQTVSPDYVYNPKKYNAVSDFKSRVADFRSTLFWNPDVNLQNDQVIRFFTSDLTTPYDAIIYGKFENGDVFNFKLKLEVVD